MIKIIIINNKYIKHNNNNIVLYQCGKASVIKSCEINRGIIYRLQNDLSSSSNCSLSYGYLFDTSRCITISRIKSNNNNIISSPSMIVEDLYMILLVI